MGLGWFAHFNAGNLPRHIWMPGESQAFFPSLINGVTH